MLDNAGNDSFAGIYAKVSTMSIRLTSSDRLAKPVVYACLGNSNVARLAMDIAIILDRESIAELSSIAGLNANFLPIVHKACTSDSIIAIEGCACNCALNALARHGLIPTHHIQLHQLAIQKREHQSCTLGESYHALCYAYEALGIVSMTLREWRTLEKRAFCRS